MDAVELEDLLGKKQEALEKIEHAVAQTHLDPPKVSIILLIDMYLVAYIVLPGVR